MACSDLSLHLTHFCNSPIILSNTAQARQALNRQANERTSDAADKLPYTRDSKVKVEIGDEGTGKCVSFAVEFIGVPRLVPSIATAACRRIEHV